MVDTDFAWRLTQGLVRIDSSDPGAYEGEIERYIKVLVEAQLERLSHPVLHAVQVEELEVLTGRRNLMVTVPGLSDEPRLVYICHMDTVTLGDGWDADITPLGAVVRDGKLYGRGACDMKGGLACAIAALVHTLERVAADAARSPDLPEGLEMLRTDRVSYDITKEPVEYRINRGRIERTLVSFDVVI